MRADDHRLCEERHRELRERIEPLEENQRTILELLREFRHLVRAITVRLEALDARSKRFERSLNVSQSGSDLRIQLQTDPRYFTFVERSTTGHVLGLSLPVARIEDLFQGKVWAALERGRRPSKRQKDLADIARSSPASSDRRPA